MSNVTNIEETAANYVLGVLSKKERATVGAQIASNPAIAQHVKEWADRLAPLFDDTKAIEPPEELFSKIESAIDRRIASGADSSITIRKDEGDWITIAPGVQKKRLYLDDHAQKEAYLLDFEPGVSLPEHHHHATEDCLVLAGDFWIGDLQLKAGDFHAAFAPSQHLPCRSEHGCRLFIKAAA